MAIVATEVLTTENVLKSDLMRVAELVEAYDRVLATKRTIEAVEVLKTLNVRNKDLTIDELEVDV